MYLYFINLDKEPSCVIETSKIPKPPPFFKDIKREDKQNNNQKHNTTIHSVTVHKASEQNTGKRKYSLLQETVSCKFLLEMVSSQCYRTAIQNKKNFI